MFAANLDDFFVVAVISNTARFKRRPELFNNLKTKLEESGIDHVIVELAFGDREYFCTGRANNHLQLRTQDEYWHKEALINEGVKHGLKLWPKKKNVMWMDGDCEPIGMTFRQWFAEIWNELQHYKFVQCWSWLQHLGPKGEPLGSHRKSYTGASNPSFMYNYINHGTPYPDAKVVGYPSSWGSPGLAWAADVVSFGEISGIPDAGITGGGDWYLSHLLISDLPFPEMTGYTKDYVNYWKHRQDLAERWIKRDVGYVNAFLLHHFHGKMQDRGYNWREQILQKGKFSPLTDIKRDAQGLWHLETHEPRQIWMRDQLRKYARSRNEDSIDV